jgi:hypothetical protein
LARKHLLLLIVLFVSLAVSTLPLVGAELPVVRQPNDPGYSVADRAALAAAWTAVERILNAGYPLSSVEMRRLGWSDSDFVQFAAGTLQSAGYTMLLATGSWAAGTTRTWILAGVPLSSGLGYIPVEAAPSALGSSSAIGEIAWQSGVSGGSFDPRYLSFTQATALAPNVPPAVKILITGSYVVVDEPATLMVTGSDPDGAILAYLWAFSDGTQIAGTRPVLWYAFRETGDVTVTLTVIDTRGAQTTLSAEAEVLAVEPDCGCGH